MPVTIPVTGGTIAAVEGETYILSANTTGNITFTGDVSFNVEINDDQAAFAGDNVRSIVFAAGTDPTVTIAAGVDASTHLFNADGDSLTMNIGDGTTLGVINGDSVSGPSGVFDLNIGSGVSITDINGPNSAVPTTIDAGDNLSVTSNILGSSIGDNTFNFGAGLDVGGSVIATGSGDAVMTIGDNANIGIDLVTTNSGTADVTVGNNLFVGRNIDSRLGGEKTYRIGDGAEIREDVSFDGAGGGTLIAGNDLNIGVFLLGSPNVDNIIIGDGWTIGSFIDLRAGADQMRLGAQSLDTTTTITGNSGLDGLTVSAPVGEETAFATAATAANWTDNGDGTFSATNTSGSFTYSGVTYTAWETAGNPVCFTAGTQITIADGKTVAVEDLRQGDKVMTADHGLQEVKWIGRNTLSGPRLEDNMRPIRIKAGALGDGLPEQELRVSPQHRMLVRSKIAAKMFGADEVLVAAKHLVLIDGIDVITGAKSVTYVHFLCDQHEIVFANGAPTESLYTGPEALKLIAPAAAAEIMSLFPELADVDYKALSARTLAGGRKGRQFAVRHKNNHKPVLTTRH